MKPYDVPAFVTGAALTLYCAAIAVVGVIA